MRGKYVIIFHDYILLDDDLRKVDDKILSIIMRKSFWLI